MFGVLHSYTSGILTSATNSISGLLPVASLPPAPTGAKTIWKYGLFPMFIPFDDAEKEAKRIQDLFVFFKTEHLRAKLEPKHILCALHNPGLALDLIVLYNIRSPYDNFVKAHYYQQYLGTNRDRLYDNLCLTIEQDASIKPFVYETLRDTTKLLYQVLEDHRYSYSPQAYSRNNPDTLSRLNSRLRERKPSIPTKLTP